MINRNKRNIQFKIMLNEEEKNEIERICERLDLTMSQFIRKLVRDFKESNQ